MSNMYRTQMGVHIYPLPSAEFGQQASGQCNRAARRQQQFAPTTQRSRIQRSAQHRGVRKVRKTVAAA